ncbi:hypothetical protein TWF730_009803 [Orbilia blumenaviensis]|uniref:Uncharacterized protein n=1 Tax=Orbilia blumenaviensis TaxID=1796055 RepID=A0AAV9UTM3_9PEZI
MQSTHKIPIRARSISLSTILSIGLLSTTFTLGSPIDSFSPNLNKDKPGLNLFSNTSFVPDPQLTPNKTSITRTPVIARLGPRTDSPSNFIPYDGNEDDDDDDDDDDTDDDDISDDDDHYSDIPWEDHDRYPPIIFDFFTDAGLYIACTHARHVMTLRRNAGRTKLPPYLWPNFEGHNTYARVAAILSYQEKCRTCRCSPDGEIVPNPAPNPEGAKEGSPGWNYCQRRVTAVTCAIAAGCYCTAKLITPTSIPLSVPGKMIQDTLDLIPIGIRLANQGYRYTHAGNGETYGFSPDKMENDLFPDRKALNGDMDPIAAHNKDGDSKTSGEYPLSKISPHGIPEYLVPDTEEPYYLQGPETDASIQSRGPRYNPPPAMLRSYMGYGTRMGRNPKRDISNRELNDGVSVWDGSRVLRDASKDQTSKTDEGRSTQANELETPTKTIKS